MRPNLPFLSATSNTIPNPDGLLRWKVWLVKDARLLLPLTELMKIARLTSPLLDVPRQSLPRPRLKHGRRFVLPFHLGLTLNLCTLFFVQSLPILPVVAVDYWTPSEGWGHGGKPRSPRSWATPQGLDQMSYRDRESPKSKELKESVAGQCRMR